MGRGLGIVQKKILDALATRGGLMDSIEIAAIALGKDQISDSEHVSFRRALRNLADKGKIIDLGRGWTDGRKRWATPKVAEAYVGRVVGAFGKSSPMGRRQVELIEKHKAKHGGVRPPKYHWD